MDQSKLLEDKLGGRGQHSEAVPHAGPEVDRGGLLEVLSGTGNLADPEAEVDTLCEHLIVKDKTVGVLAGPLSKTPESLCGTPRASRPAGGSGRRSRIG